MNTENLLIEIGTEELPPKSLKKLAEAFQVNLAAELEKLELSFNSIAWYAAPRRLALKILDLSEGQADKIVEKRGPAVTAAFDTDGHPTKAAEGWARSNGITVDKAERLKTDKGEWLLHKAEVKGRLTSELLPVAVNNALAKLPIPKPMRWGSSNTQFIRPVKTVVMLFGAEHIHGDVLGVQSGNKIQGHRFHHPELVSISHADEYLSLMEAAHVMADYEQRKNVILEQVHAAAATIGGVAIIDEDLLDEVTSLVEWPVTLVGSFEDKFLSVPAEALIYTMQDNQKYFAARDDKGELLAKFIFVSNIESKDPTQVISGNEKVVRPRLADAEFFFETDKKSTLASRLETLGTVTFQKQLGTMLEKSERIAELSARIAGAIGADASLAKRAGLLSKTDLMTEMVMEFTDVQGVMGRYYAQHDGEDAMVALALQEQYYPRFSGDVLPSNGVSSAVSLADKLDTLIGIFGIGQAPKSDKDPFALRRAAIGVLRTIVEHGYHLDLTWLIEQAVELYTDKLTSHSVKEDVLEFIFGRFKSWYQEQGISVDIIQAVMARKPSSPSDFDQRIKAVSHFKSLDECEALAAANKRVGNILSKVKDISDHFDVSVLTENEEKQLAEQMVSLESELSTLYSEGMHQEALVKLSTLRHVIDTFFDNVMVMADDDVVRNNRLALLSHLRKLFLRTADISLLQ